MDIAQIIPVADSWGMHDGDIRAGWLIVMVPLMLLMMGGMMWMMMRGMTGGSSPSSSSASTTESPAQILERRFAEGDISIDEYRARREALDDGKAKPNINAEDEPLPAARGEDGGPP